MSSASFVSALPSALLAGEVVASELGLFFVVRWPASIGRNPRTGADVAVPPKLEPVLVPSDALLTRVGAERALRASDYREALARDLMGTVDIVRGEPIVSDPDDEHVSVHVPEATRALDAAALYEDVATRLATKRRVAVSSLGTFERTTVPRGPLRGRVGVAFAASMVLKSALNPR